MLSFGMLRRRMCTKKMTMNERYMFMLEQLVWLLTAYYKQSGDYKVIFEEFDSKFLNVPMPSRQMVLNMHNKFQRMGPVSNAPRSGRQQMAQMPENYVRVAQAMVQDRACFGEQTALELDLTCHSLHRMIN